MRMEVLKEKAKGISDPLYQLKISLKVSAVCQSFKNNVLYIWLWIVELCGVSVNDNHILHILSFS